MARRKNWESNDWQVFAGTVKSGWRPLLQYRLPFSCWSWFVVSTGHSQIQILPASTLLYQYGIPASPWSPSLFSIIQIFCPSLHPVLVSMMQNSHLNVCSRLWSLPSPMTSDAYGVYATYSTRIIHHGKNIFVRTGMSRLSSSRMIKWSTLLPAPLMLPRIPLKQRVRQVPRVLDLSAFFKAK